MGFLKHRLESMHKEVRDTSDRIHARNQRKATSEPNFFVGDFVLWSRVDRESIVPKLQFIWRGPFRVVDVKSDHLFVIEQLRTKDAYTVHASRLMFYHDNSLNVTAELLEHIDHQGILYNIDELKELQWNQDLKQWQIRVSWEGFEGEDTWEPVASMLKDIPDTTCAFLATVPKQKLRQ